MRRLRRQLAGRRQCLEDLENDERRPHNPGNDVNPARDELGQLPCSFSTAPGAPETREGSTIPK